jgi:folate-binding protein YgfZ
MSPSASTSCPPGYREFRDAAAWVELPSRTTVHVRGRDAVRFVDKFTTAALAHVPPGGGAEGFFTDVRGWVLALAALLRGEDDLWIDAMPGLGDLLATHLEHYHIREDFVVTDASTEYGSVLVAGPSAAEWLHSRWSAPLPERPFGHVAGRLGDVTGRIVNIDWYGPCGFLVQIPAADLPRLASWLAAAGLPAAGLPALEAVRIEERLPAPADIVEKTLPQELDRNGRAISFTKGCYLGQETVARIDALGHVNRRLTLLAIDLVPPPPPGSAVTSGGEPVGTLTSSCLSPRLGTSAGLAILQRRGLEAADLEVAGAAARVVPVAVSAA